MWGLLQSLAACAYCGRYTGRLLQLPRGIMSRERTGAKPSMFQRAFSSILEEPPEPEPLIAAASAPHPVPELLSVTSAGVDSAHAEGEAGIGNVSLRLGQHSASVNARAESTDGRTTSSASRASQAGDVALAAEVDGPGEEQQEAEQHGWAVNFVVSRIGVPKKLWQGLVMQPDGRMQTCDPQSRRGIFGLHILSPFHPIAVAWVSFMLLFDLIYTVGAASRSFHAALQRGKVGLGGEMAMARV